MPLITTSSQASVRAVTPAGVDGQGMVVLVLDSDLAFARAAARRLALAGFRSGTATSMAGAVERWESDGPDVVLIDPRWSDGQGIEWLSSACAGAGSPAWLALCAVGDAEAALRALRAGAAACIKKPADLDEVVLAVQRALAVVHLQHDATGLRARERHAECRVELAGHSSAMRTLRDRLEVLGHLDTAPGAAPLPVVLHGEVGTGKTTAARYLHQQGAWADRPFVRVDCSAGDVGSAESPTTALPAALGPLDGLTARALLSAAAGGTVFLDDVDRLTPSAQAQWFEAIESHATPSVADGRARRAVPRLVAASRQDLGGLVRRGRLRADLFQRLQGMAVGVPPLRERGDDAVQLAHLFVARACARFGLAPKTLDDAAAEQLSRHGWPGNVSELRCVVECAVWRSGPVMGAATLGLRHPTDPGRAASAGDALRCIEDLTLDQAERFLIDRALAVTGGNVSSAARRLGMTRMALRYRLQRRRAGTAP